MVIKKETVYKIPKSDVISLIEVKVLSDLSENLTIKDIQIDDDVTFFKLILV